MPTTPPKSAAPDPADPAKLNRAQAELDFSGPPPRLHPADGTPTSSPRLRLVSRSARFRPSLEVDRGRAIRGTTDPRWVLAVRAAEQLQGATLTPPARDRLVRMAKAFGLTAFDANLIIAIVQDQARRGYAPAFCPTAGEPQLRMVPLPTPRTWPRVRLVRVTAFFGVLIAAELIMLLWYFQAAV